MNRDGRVKGQQGYTILEALIFLAVSAALFTSAMVVISGRQSRAEFSTGYREFESTMSDIANDIEDGYYNNVVTSSGKYVSCTADASGISFSTSSDNKQGGNSGCLLIGNALQVATAGTDGRGMNLIPLAGRQYIAGTTDDTTSYQQSGVVPITGQTNSTVRGGGRGVIAPVPAASVDASSALSTGPGVAVACMFYVPTVRQSMTPRGETLIAPSLKPCGATTASYIDVIAFMTNLENSTGINVVVPKGSSSVVKDGGITDATKTLLNFSTEGETVINPDSGVYICLQSQGTNQYALVKIGGGVGRLTTSSEVKEGSCS